MINDGNTPRDILLIDSNDIEYTSAVNEIPTSSLQFAPKEVKTISVKFNKVYNTNVKIKSMQINNIYLNKNQYDENLEQEKCDKTSINIQL